ncbi:hypothetical protein MCOR25_003819 [Pyricularia grisea]|uniref:Oxidoreductase-like protein n=1 Tax=Pyricularia grisea TaxID=148305 RepID=A0A6P8BLB9_PYRGI|nr:uncharacterized protein PgNI_00549 [Pyricularia grisea]KAI6372085.1 hypothetical protein MCOR25_003819 [Pyricularia grisea]TLD17402.1 hypothetical protein PgNI_00549 [Pyricularia grisea]
MAQAVEARSLSRLNALAANPPQYPVNPTEQRQEPLVLYISRVPGSRDVIFSPFKPQLKNVTGEDVANSLYYIHLDTPSDFDLQEAPGTATSNESQYPRPSLETSPTSRGASSAPRSPITRKPLPASAKALSIKSIPDTTPPSAAVLSRDREPDSPTGAKGAPVIINSSEPSPVDKQVPELKNEVVNPSENSPAVPLKDTSPIPRSPTQQVPITRKPLGPRALSNQSTRSVNGGTCGLLQPNHNTDIRSNSSDSIVHSVVENRRNTHTSEFPAVQSPLSPLSPRSPSPRMGPRDLVPFTLTVIRRDPSTGNQWNVGKVSSYQLLNPTVPTLDPEAPPSYAELAGLVPTTTPTAALAVPPNISIRVETSGYAKFRGNFPTRDSIDINRRQRATSAASSVTGASTDSLSLLRGSGAVTGEDIFTRQLMMSYQKSWTSNIKDAWRNRNRSNSSSPPQPESKPPISPLEPPPTLPFHGRARSDSGGSGESLSPPNGSPTKGSFSLQALRQNQKSNCHGNVEHDPRQLITAPGPGLKPRGYVFASPWDGICEFKTSSSGRGVKCVHSLPGGPVHADGGTTVGTTVSELRFNLPSADMFREKGQELQGKFDRLKIDGQNRLQEQWNKGHRRAQSSVDSNSNNHSHNGDDHDDVGLSLGRERAGGGNRGKRAKLGKLIIYDEGLKMLDLVVAANVGIWWGAWERSF